MRKPIRLWVKQEKRIVNLLWQKGLFPSHVKPKDIYWEAYRHRNNGNRRRKGKRDIWCDYLPEVFWGSTDYWGEYDDNIVVSYALDGFYWGEVEEDWDMHDGWPASKFKYRGRQWFINFLKSLPTVNHIKLKPSQLKVDCET